MDSSPAAGVGGPVFIVGAPRSGTHLLRYCLSRHSAIHIGPETGAFIRIWGNRRLVPPSRFRRSPELILDLLFGSGDPSMQDYLPHRDRIAEIIRCSAEHRDLILGLLGFYATVNNKRRCGEKTPLHALFIPEIRRVIPEARVIAIIREPRNVVASYLKSRHMPDSLERALVETRRCVEAVERSSGSVLTVRYEDLVADSEAVLRKVSDYLGESFEPAMMQPGMVDSSFEDRIMRRDPDIGIRRDPDEADRWRRVLTEDQGRMVEAWMSRDHGAIPASRRGSLAVVDARFGLTIRKARVGLEGFPSRRDLWTIRR